jgi:hypothetical protein
MILLIYPTRSNICTQRKRAKAATAARAQTTPEMVRDEAPLNTGDGLLLAVVLAVVPALAPTPAAPDGVAMDETLAVEEMVRVRLEGVLDLVETINSFEPAPAPEPDPDPETPVSVAPLAPPIAGPVTVTREKTVEVLVSVPTITVVVATGTDEV